MADKIPGLLVPGNIDLSNRPMVKGDKGQIHTVLSFSFGDEKGREVLIPRVIGGKVYSEKDAQEHYFKTGEHLGIFADPKSATAYGIALHDKEAERINKKPRMTPKSLLENE